MADFLVQAGSNNPCANVSAPNWNNGDGTNAALPGWEFLQPGGTSVEYEIPSLGYTSGSLTFRIKWWSLGQSGSLQWSVAIAAITPGDAQSVLTKAFAAAAQNAVATTVNATQAGANETEVVVPNVDNLAAGDILLAKISRVASGTLGQGAVMTGFTVSYS